MQNQNKCEIAFDAQLKTVLKSEGVWHMSQS